MNERTTIAPPGWQDATVRELTRLLQADPRVQALALFGTTAQARQDRWSDVDLLLVVEEAAKAGFTPGVDWLKPLGELYCASRSGHPLASTARAVFRDFRRLDFVITTEEGLERADEWPGVPFWRGTRALFSRSPRVDAVLARRFACPQPGLMTDEQFAAMANDFWFKGTLAVTKVMRDDLLIALHLTLEMVQECCVLGMLLRDRAEGTAHHRHGGSGNAVVANLDPTRQPYTPLGILECIEQSAIAFDALAAQWMEGYHEQRHPLLAWIQAARGSLVG